MERKCPSCDTVLLDEDKECPNCPGAIIVFVDGQEFECPICGTRLPSNQIRCLVCETVFEVEGDLNLCEEIFECPECGKTFERPVSFCPDCGSEFDGVEEERFIREKKASNRVRIESTV